MEHYTYQHIPRLVSSVDSTQVESATASFKDLVRVLEILSTK